MPAVRFPQERVRLATQAFNSCNERRRRRKKPSKDLTLNPDVEDDNDEDDNTEEGLFSCPICEAVFSRSVCKRCVYFIQQYQIRN